MIDQGPVPRMPRHLPAPQHRTAEDIDRHALSLLKNAGARVSKLLRVTSDHIIYLNGAGRIMTGWRWTLSGGRESVTFEPGLPIEPSPEMVPRELRA